MLDIITEIASELMSSFVDWTARGTVVFRSAVTLGLGSLGTWLIRTSPPRPATVTPLEIHVGPKRGQGRTHKPPRPARSRVALGTVPRPRSGTPDRLRPETFL